MSKKKKIDDSELSEVSGAGPAVIDLDAGNFDGGLVDPFPDGGLIDGTGTGDSRGGGGHGGRIEKRKDFADPD